MTITVGIIGGSGLDDPDFFTEISDRWIKNFERIEIKGLGPTTVQAINKENIPHIKELLMSYSILP